MSISGTENSGTVMELKTTTVAFGGIVYLRYSKSSAIDHAIKRRIIRVPAEGRKIKPE